MLILVILLSVSSAGVTITSAPLRNNVMLHHSIPSQTSGPLVIIGNAEVARRSIRGAGTRSDPYIIDGKEILSDSTCVHIEDTTEYFILQGGEYTIKKEGTVKDPVILLKTVQHGTIRGSQINGGYQGIQLLNVQDCNIMGCVIKSATNGILLEDADNCTIRDSILLHNEIGTALMTTTNCRFLNNTIYANTLTGIDIGPYCENNTIYDNSVGWNDLWNAVDNGINNEFTNGINRGNSWSDYNGSGSYIIHGNSQSTDEYPDILMDLFKPVISPVADRVIDVESVDEYLIWNCYDQYPDSYIIYIDDDVEVQDLWNEQRITQRIDQLPVGTYDITLKAIDAAGYYNNDTVRVTVISFMLGGIGTDLVLMASGITVAVFLVVIIVIKKVL